MKLEDRPILASTWRRPPRRRRFGKRCVTPSTKATSDEKVNTRLSLYEDHRLLALKVVFSQELLTMLLSKKELREIETGGRLMKLVVDGHLKHGLVDGHNKGIPVFVNKTFAEFFAAHFLANEVREEDNAEGDVTKFVASMYGNSDYDGVLNFFDALGAKCHALHCHVMNNDWRSVGDVAEVPFSRDAFSRLPMHIAALYADEETLDKVIEMHGEKMAEELLEEDGLGMTPLTYADRLRHWKRLNELCRHRSEKSVNWAKQLPVATRNITEKRDFGSSVIGKAVLMELKELLNCILKAFAVLKNAERPLVTDPQETGHNQRTTKHPEIDIDTIQCNVGHTPIFHVKSYEVFKVLLPYSDIRVVAKDGSTLLHAYAAVGAHDACKYVLSHLPSDASDADGRRPLHLSTICSNSDIVHMLIPHSTSRYASDKQGDTALHLAAYNGYVFESNELCVWLPFCALYSTTSVVQTEVIKKILPHVDITSSNCDGDTVLHKSSYCNSTSAVTLLLPYSDVDMKRKAGDNSLLGSVSRGRILGRRVTTAVSTVLDVCEGYISELLDGITREYESRQETNPERKASEKEDIKVMKLILLHSVVNAVDEDGGTSLHLSVRAGELDVVKLLYHHLSANDTDTEGLTSCHWAAISGHLHVVNFFFYRMCFNARDHKGATPLVYGALYGHIDIVKVLLPMTSADILDTYGYIPLHYSANEGYTEIAQFLLPHSFASKDAKDGFTPLHLTARKDHVETSRVILPHSDTAVCNDNGDTAIHVCTYKHYCEVVQLLLPYSELNAANKSGKTALLQACCGTHRSKQENAAESTRSSSTLGTQNVKMIKLLLLHSVVNAADKDDCTALHLSARTGNLDVVKLLFPHLSANDTDKRGQNSFHRSVIGGHLDVVNFFLSRMCFNARDHKGATPLVYSALYGYIGIVKRLLPLISADVSDTYGLIPLHYSPSEGHTDTVEYLLPHSFTSKGNKHGSTALHLSAQYGRVEATGAILPHSDTVISDGDGDTALLCSAHGNCCDVVKLLLVSYSEVNATNKCGMTALAYIFHEDIQQFEKKSENSEENKESEVPEKKDIKMIKLLILHANSNVVDNDGRTVSRLAASRRWFNINKLFLPHLDVTSVGIQVAHEDAVELQG
ncbi:ankyrin-1-like [Ornithodoros turicata]|uniref:ankyrin-1-like n=1 Tax=Ornithodoros turicata TaxID=34597 RepID=UPI00313A14F7